MNADATVREARPDDADGIARVHVTAWRETYSGTLPDEMLGDEALPRRVAYWTRFLAAEPPPGRLVVAERDGTIVGFASSGPARGPDAEKGIPPARDTNLFTIYLLASAHGSGLGQAMLDAVLGAEPAQLWVLSNNHRALAFYARNGFVPDSVQVEDASHPGVVELRLVR